jgi:hypothetical protein
LGQTLPNPLTLGVEGIQAQTRRVIEDRTFLGTVGRPGMPGQPMYFVVPAKAANPKVEDRRRILISYIGPDDLWVQ